MNMRATPTTTPRYVLMEEQSLRRFELHTLEVWQTPSVGEVCECPEVSSLLNSYLVLKFVYVLASYSLLKKKMNERSCHGDIIVSINKKNTVASTLNVRLLTLNKALPGGRPRITRFVLMLIAF